MVENRVFCDVVQEIITQNVGLIFLIVINSIFDTKLVSKSNQIFNCVI